MDGPKVTNALEVLLASTEKQSLSGAAISMIRRDLIVASLLYLLQVGCTLCTPFIIYEFLKWVQRPDPQWSHGAGLCVALGCAASVAFVAENRFEHTARAAGITIRKAILGLLYRKVLRLSSADASSTHSGEVLNLFGADATALLEAYSGLLTLLLQPLEILAIVGLLWVFVDIAALAGVAVVAVAMSMTLYGSLRVEAYSHVKSGHADSRLRDTNEMLTGMKVVKLNAWEGRFAAAITARRAAESAISRAAALHLAYINTVSSNSVDVISLAVILAYTLPSALGRRLDPETTFTYWVLLGMLHGRVFHFPVAVKHWTEGAAALARLQAFLARPERVDAREGQDSSRADVPSNACIWLQDASFTWAASDSSAPPTPLLHKARLTIPHGSLTAIVGPVGSGKSSLLAAVLGEMTCMEGRIAVVPRDPAPAPALPPTATSTQSRSTVAYVPQQSWAVAGSVRDNICFGQEYEEAWYKRVVFACALEHDFASWPGGDSAVVGAFTLSGGQKQRISIARAVYARAHLYCIDDCLSALDQRVGKHVLQHALIGLLGDTLHATRLVVTNSALLIHAADTLVVLMDVARSSGGGGEGDKSHGPFTTLQGPPSELILNPTLAPLLGHLRAQGGSEATVDEVLQGAGGDSSASEVQDSTDDSSSSSSSSSGVVRKGKGGMKAGLSYRLLMSADSGAGQVASSTRKVEEEKPLSLPFMASWISGAGGPVYAWTATALLVLEAFFVEASVLLLASWSDDPSYTRYSYWTYLGLYGGAVALEQVSAYVRQHVYAAGTIRAADSLHASLLFRICHTKQSWFDTHSPSLPLNWFGSSLAEIEAETWYGSEYFWLGFIYALLLVVVSIVITPWILLPSAVAALLFYAAMREVGAGGGPGEQLPVQGSSQEKDGDAVVATIANPLHSTGKAAVDDEVAAGGAGGHPFMPGSMGSIPTLLARESRVRAPMEGHWGSTLEGLTCLRAYGCQPLFEHAHHAHVDRHSEALARAHDAQSAQTLLCNLIGAVYYVLSVLILVPLVYHGSGGPEGERLSGGDAGFVVVNSVFASYLCVMIMQQRAKLVSLAMTRGRVLRAMSSLPQEASVRDDPAAARESAAIQRSYGRLVQSMRGKGGARGGWGAGDEEDGAEDALLSPVSVPRPVHAAPVGWPSKGALSFKEVYLSYGKGAGAPAVLKGLTFDIPAGYHVGVVGRTGAGKSTVLAALTRMVDIRAGSIAVDGQDIGELPLHVVRDAVAVISQDPLFFADTLRRNLDPFRQYSEAALLSSLSSVHLLDYAAGQAQAQGCASPLDVQIAEKGANLSVGQQQLLALARALLRTPVLLCLDEATASLDVGTEALVNAAVHEVFKESTVLQIAHRLVSVIGAHHVLVLSEGRVVEAGHPWVLVSRPPLPSGTPVHAPAPGEQVAGLFASMVAALPEAQQEQLRQQSKAAYDRHVLEGKVL